MWPEENQQEIRERLLDVNSGVLIQFMCDKSLQRDTTAAPSYAAHIASELGWTDGLNGPLTSQGRLVADSCREYSFWLERDKALPFEGAAPHLTASYFSDRTVLEIGSGMGANLLSLKAAGAKVIGVEPTDVYRHLGQIFAEREELDCADLRCGQAEALPFGDNEIDTVLCVSAHQYFEVHQALAEISRILKPGGELIIVGGTLQTYGVENAKNLVRGMAGAKAYIITIVNSLSYMAAGRRVLLSRGEFSTSRPIYPSRTAMRRWLRSAELDEVSPTCRVDSETCFHFAAT